MKKLRRAEEFPPGEFIEDEPKARKRSIEYFAEKSGLGSRRAQDLIDAKVAVTPEIAKGLSGAFGSSAQTWLNLETSYRQWKAEKARRAS
ncbi:MAG: transcriptional regulator [Chloroflexi bacterium]|nr:transcriptional regulator [Chloroflexota bacterium]